MAGDRAPDWRPAETAPVGVWVIAYHKAGREVVVAKRDEDDGGWVHADILGMRLECVTHWMPLPEPPLP